MENYSLPRFSRYFFALFLGITLLPLLILMLASDYYLHKSDQQRQGQFTGFVAADVLKQYDDTLTDSKREIERIINTLPNQALPLKQYRVLFNAKEIWLVDSKPARTFLQTHPDQAFLRTATPGHVQGDYFVGAGHVDLVLRVPLRGASDLLITREVPDKSVFPQAPFRIEVFQGSQIHPGNRLALSPFERHPPEYKQGDPLKIVAQTQLPLKNHAGHPIATVRVQALHYHEEIAFMENLNRLLSAVLVLAGLIGSLLAGTYLQNNFINPLMSLSYIANRVKEGDLQIRANTEGIRQADVRQTLDRVNLMLEGLAEKEQLRSSFISNLTHDFRTPLIAEHRSLELLNREFQELGLIKQQGLALGILKNNEHLLAMVNQLLETYQSEAGQFTLNLRYESLPALIDECFAQTISLADERDITLSHDFAEGFPRVEVDEHYLKRVFINLLGNAIENIPRGSRIQIMGSVPKEGEVELRVRDSGSGISAEDMEHLFDRYYAGSDTRKLGSGLGLYICKLLVEAHRGSIFAEKSPQNGTDFVIRLPVTATVEECA